MVDTARVAVRRRPPPAALTRRGAIQVGLAPAVAALAGCGAGDQPGGAGGAIQGPVTIRYAAEFGPREASTYAAGLTRIVEAFNARGGPVRVQTETPNPFYPGLLAQAAAGDPPDVTHTHPREYHPFVNAGALVELDAFMKRDRRNMPDVNPTVLQYWSRDGHNYGLPNAHAIQAVYFNRALFEKQGLKTPDQYEREGKWTFDTYLELGRKLTTGSGDTKVWGAFWPNNTLDIQAGFIWSFGGQMWDPPMQNTLLDSRESLAAIQFQADLTAKYGASPTADERRQLPSANGAVLAAERAPTEILMTTALGQLTPTTFPKGMAPMPKGPAGRLVRGAPLGVQLMTGANHHEAAWEHATFHAGLEAERIMLDLHLSVAWHKSSLGSAAYAKLLSPWESHAFYVESANRVRPTPYPGQFTAIDRIYANAYDTVRHGQKTARQAIEEIKPEINALLRQK